MSVQIHTPQHELVVQWITITITPTHDGDADPITYDIKNTRQQQFHGRMFSLTTWYKNTQMPVTATNMNNMLMLYSPKMSEIQLGHMIISSSYFLIAFGVLVCSFLPPQCLQIQVQTCCSQHW